MTKTLNFSCQQIMNLTQLFTEEVSQTCSKWNSILFMESASNYQNLINSYFIASYNLILIRERSQIRYQSIRLLVVYTCNVYDV